jgi:cytochrome c biogenesis protein CcmG, thiol:disulfide interchange protein DsbE
MSDRPHYARFLIPLTAFALLVVVFVIGLKHSPEVGVIDSPLVGRQGPAWQLPLLSDTGRMFGSSDLRGHWYVLNVWGTWCPTCQQEHHALLEIQRTSPVPIIGIDWNDSDADALRYLAQFGNPYRTVAVDHDGHTAIDWGVSAAPETFLVDPEGRIVYKYPNALTPEIWRRDFLARLPHQLAPSS